MISKTLLLITAIFVSLSAYSQTYTVYKSESDSNDRIIVMGSGQVFKITDPSIIPAMKLVQHGQTVKTLYVGQWINLGSRVNGNAATIEVEGEFSGKVLEIK